jgi:surface antigen|tara:strand:+ start:24363 stop:24863 length:501 start_codon:yes stop_codon:yes gene_type:complete
MKFGLTERLLNNVALYVKNSTVVGKSLIILTISLFLTACGATSQQYSSTSISTGASTAQYYHSKNSMLGLGINYFKWTYHMMEPYDREQQQHAIFFALNNLQNGETTRWYNGNTGAKGAVQVAMTYPQGSGYCRVLMSQIYYKGKQRDFKETACINSVDNTWRFVR